jgi:hypothetical protein
MPSEKVSHRMSVREAPDIRHNLLKLEGLRDRTRSQGRGI